MDLVCLYLHPARTSKSMLCSYGRARVDKTLCKELIQRRCVYMYKHVRKEAIKTSRHEATTSTSSRAQGSRQILSTSLHQAATHDPSNQSQPGSPQHLGLTDLAPVPACCSAPHCEPSLQREGGKGPRKEGTTVDPASAVHAILFSSAPPSLL